MPKVNLWRRWFLKKNKKLNLRDFRFENLNLMCCKELIFSVILKNIRYNLCRTLKMKSDYYL